MVIKTGKRDGSGQSLSKVLGIKTIAGVKLIVPLTKIDIRKGFLFYQREVTR